MPANPEEIYERAKSEGHRRLAMPPLEQASTGFIAGVTVVFGIVALGMARGFLEPEFGPGPAKLGGALAFGVGLVFLVVGRTELFTENFFDPVAAVAEPGHKSRWTQLGRLWILVFILNLVGGAIMLGVFSVHGTLPAEAHDALIKVAEEISGKSGLATFTRGIAAGTLLTLLSYLLNAVDSTGSRIAVSYLVGFFLALGPFDHVVVSALHLLFGVWTTGEIGYPEVGSNIAFSAGGNLVGGLLLMTLTHAVQVKTSRQASE